MSNLKQPPLRFDTFFDDDEKNQRMKQVFDDLYKNTSFKDVTLETITPNKDSMADGESKFAKVDDETRRYYRLGNDLYYQVLTKVTTNNYVKLKVTDVDGAITGQLWYDESENKLKFKTVTAVETITSS